MVQCSGRLQCAGQPPTVAPSRQYTGSLADEKCHVYQGGRRSLVGEKEQESTEEEVFMEKQMNPESMGVVTDSSGNHAQAVAYAARCVGLPCTVVVPKGAPKVKCDAIQEYGASLVFCDPSPTASNYHVIAGQGTLALELLEEVRVGARQDEMRKGRIPDLDAILVPVSGGGMLAGVSVVAHLLQPKCQVYAVEPVGKDLQRCLEAKERLWPSPPVFLNTVADSIRLQEVGELTFPIICEYANHKVFTVTDEKMVQGMKLIFERMKQVVEAASGAGVYAAVHLLKDIQPKAKKVGVILCGGNVDLDVLPWLTRTTSYQSPTTGMSKIPETSLSWGDPEEGLEK
ncbi:Serine racemase [Portunus trituberculatus]|uniref:Serine racemase n=1 Tax=Portunus trituberculatus TaxID=210409 RepID=A0A5B7D348_PORTR|nr:Serine racemase [Portunus trituberculatus]